MTSDRASPTMTRMRLSPSLFLALLPVIAACDDSSSSAPPPGTFVRPTSLTFEVDYETNAAPYGGLSDGSVFATNVDALFPFLGAAYSAPATVGEMENLGPIADDSLTVEEILAIADQHRSGASNGSARHHYIVFIDGYFEDDTGTRDNILGVSLGYTGVVAMFKPVIASASIIPSVRAYLEQTVLVHEFGHEIGLVDNGIAMVTDHLDVEHGRHCTNEDCVMFWANHTGNDILSFVTARMSSSSDVLFDADCLADVRANYGP